MTDKQILVAIEYHERLLNRMAVTDQEWLVTIARLEDLKQLARQRKLTYE